MKLIAVGLFSPSTSGLARANTGYVQEFRCRGGQVAISDTGPSKVKRVATLYRAVAALRAAVRVVLSRSVDWAMVGLEGDDGIALYLPTAAVARIRGVPILYVHHSSRHFEADSRILRVAEVVGVSLAYTMEHNLQTYVERARSRALGVAYFGLRSKEKGFIEAISAADVILGDFDDAGFVVAGPHEGPGPDLDPLARLAERYPNRVLDLGALDPSAVAKALQETQVLLFPTRYPHETFGLTASEALAAGRFVVGWPRWCLDTKRLGGGVLVPPGQGTEMFVEVAVNVVGDARQPGGAERLVQGALWASHVERVCSRRRFALLADRDPGCVAYPAALGHEWERCTASGCYDRISDSYRRVEDLSRAVLTEVVRESKCCALQQDPPPGSRPTVIDQDPCLSRVRAFATPKPPPEGSKTDRVEHRGQTICVHPHSPITPRPQTTLSSGVLNPCRRTRRPAICN